MRVLVLFIVGLAGCFSTNAKDGALVCASNSTHACPDNYHCAADNHCWHNGHDPAPGDLGGDDLNANADLLPPPALCGNGKLDPGEDCDPGVGSAMPCPTIAECDDQSSCTTDGVTGSGCQITCTHTPANEGQGCTAAADAGGAGTCTAGVCCTGCVAMVNGTYVCKALTEETATQCGAGGSSCFDCTKNSATATCGTGGICSGCDQASCTSENRICGTSSCGYPCGTCQDTCTNGGGAAAATVQHYTCSSDGKTCNTASTGDCGKYTGCADSHTCSTSCTDYITDAGCISSAWCASSTSACVAKAAAGAACASEGASYDHQCQAGLHCSFTSTADHNSYTAICNPTVCTGCTAATGTGCTGANVSARGLPYQQDPRGACQSAAGTACQAKYCSGFGVCDYGIDGTYAGNNAAVYRPCGTITVSTTTCGGDVYKATGVFCGATNPGSCNTTSRTMECYLDGQGFEDNYVATMSSAGICQWSTLKDIVSTTCN